MELVIIVKIVRYADDRLVFQNKNGIMDNITIELMAIMTNVLKSVKGFLVNIFLPLRHDIIAYHLHFY